jgi:hypothetical protein
MPRTIHACGDGADAVAAVQIEAQGHALKAAMSRDFKTLCLRVAALGAAACGSAYAIQSSGDGQPLEPLATVGQPITSSPYEVELIDDGGQPLETFQRGDRFYVLGRAGDRYSIRVKNPTPRRVEAILSVDGLDVIDGEDADLARKRGYVIQPGGELVVDGFRTSTTQVAAFRFSSVGESYAELKGKGRNVGVIGVAIFEEKAQPQIAQPAPLEQETQDDADGWGDDPAAGGAPPSGAESGAGSGAGSGAVNRAPNAEPADRAERRAESAPPSSTTPAPRPDFQPERKKSRSGLGTQWGEERYSAVDFTSFERASETPTAVAELRYNDVEGLRALGIALEPAPDGDELMQRETADPFPASRGFATPPQ